MKVLIGIPTLNGPDRLDRALKSIKTYTDLKDVVVFVSDDASTAKNLKLNKDVVHVHGVEMLMSEERLGVAKQWNSLVRHVPDAEICVLLNDDVEVVEDWLDVLVFSLQKNPSIGTIGLRSEYGMTAAQAVAEGQFRPRRDYYDSRIVDGGGSLLWSPGPCFAFRRRDWEAVDEFDEDYFMYYVDADFGIALQHRGKVNCLATYPVIYHLGGATMTTLDPVPAIEQGRQHFETKWHKSFTAFREELGGRLQTYIEWNSSWKKWP